MKIPFEIDDLMWQLAEADDAKALEEFSQKHPDYVPEMTKRLGIVRGLKGSKPVSAVKPRARFMPSRNVAPQPAIPGYVLGVVMLALVAGAAFATVGVMRYLDSKKPVTIVRDNRPSQPITQPQQNNPAPPKTTPQNPPDTNNQTVQAPPSPFDTPVTVVSSKTGLKDALADIAGQAGIQLQLAPNFPDIEITIDYRGVPARQVLDDMGRNFGFTVFKQTENTGLVIPAVEPGMDKVQPRQLPGTSGVAKDPDKKGDGPVLELPGNP